MLTRKRLNAMGNMWTAHSAAGKPGGKRQVERSKHLLDRHPDRKSCQLDTGGRWKKLFLARVESLNTSESLLRELKGFLPCVFSIISFVFSLCF